MAVELTWLGHGTWLIQSGSHRLILDPFLNESPTAPCRAESIDVDFVLVSHGHFDHVADAAAIAKRCGATLVSNWEICQWFGQQGVENTHPMNTGGTAKLAFGTVQSTIAFHSSTLPDGASGGNPGGFVLQLDGRRIYFACDTSVFSDMQRIGRGGLDLAVLPIGDTFTMGPSDSIEAIELLAPRRVAPAHYNTWPPIAQDAAAWAAQVRSRTQAEPVVLDPGGKLNL
ncbi:MAG: metal-dependent hydrolase [Pirellulales bacterium]|nr:metal-dependent hydrolase [Pirellulales bacterium]